MRAIDKLIVHCSDTRPDWMADRPLRDKVAEIRRWHMEERGWSDIGYHYLIDRDGSRLEGRDVRRIGAHVQGHNEGSIGICLIGGHGAAASDAPSVNFTDPQLAALIEFLDELQEAYPGATVHGHNEFAPKACPGFDVRLLGLSKPAPPGVQTIADWQRLLASRGFEPGPVDGVWGPKTAAASEALSLTTPEEPKPAKDKARKSKETS